VFTSPDLVPYWNTTYYVLVEDSTGLVGKYAELEDLLVCEGDTVKAGQELGRVGQVLNLSRIDKGAPTYIRELKSRGASSMLHFELSRGTLPLSGEYLGGNWFGRTKPAGLMDPSFYIRSGYEGIRV
jgi:murein DD-endopeptidase MepM/ murein hydrolase activator NlpD